MGVDWTWALRIQRENGADKDDEEPQQKAEYRGPVEARPALPASTAPRLGSPHGRALATSLPTSALFVQNTVSRSWSRDRRPPSGSRCRTSAPARQSRPMFRVQLVEVSRARRGGSASEPQVARRLPPPGPRPRTAKSRTPRRFVARVVAVNDAAGLGSADECRPAGPGSLSFSMMSSGPSLRPSTDGEFMLLRFPTPHHRSRTPARPTSADI